MLNGAERQEWHRLSQMIFRLRGTLPCNAVRRRAFRPNARKGSAPPVQVGTDPAPSGHLAVRSSCVSVRQKMGLSGSERFRTVRVDLAPDLHISRERLAAPTGFEPVSPP